MSVIRCYAVFQYSWEPVLIQRILISTYTSKGKGNEIAMFPLLPLLSAVHVCVTLFRSSFYINFLSRYLLASVLIYMKRAQLDVSHYTEYNFFVCLYIAHDFFEDISETKWDILPWALQTDWYNIKSQFYQRKVRMASKPIYIRWIITGSQPYWKIMHSIVL